jgi:hypothetical protein
MKESDVLTVDFFPEKIAFPKFAQEDYLKQTAEDMLHLLTAPTTSPTATPLSFGPPILNAYEKIADILRRATTPPPQPSPAPLSPALVPPVRLTPPVAPPRVPIAFRSQAPPIYAKQLHPAKHKRSSPSLISKYQRASPCSIPVTPNVCVLHNHSNMILRLPAKCLIPQQAVLRPSIPSSKVPTKTLGQHH